MQGQFHLKLASQGNVKNFPHWALLKPSLYLFKLFGWGNRFGSNL